MKYITILDTLLWPPVTTGWGRDGVEVGAIIILWCLEGGHGIALQAMQEMISSFISCPEESPG